MAVLATAAAVGLAGGMQMYAADRKADAMEAVMEKREERAKKQQQQRVQQIEKKQEKQKKIETTQTKKRQSIIRGAINNDSQSLFDLLGSAQA